MVRRRLGTPSRVLATQPKGSKSWLVLLAVLTAVFLAVCLWHSGSLAPPLSDDELADEILKERNERYYTDMAKAGHPPDVAKLKALAEQAKPQLLREIHEARARGEENAAIEARLHQDFSAQWEK